MATLIELASHRGPGRARAAAKASHQRCEPALGEGDDGEIGHGPDLSQMGQGGSPFEMMQKMIAQMGEGGKPPAMDKMMGMCMGMCSEMLSAIRQTNALAVHATPELQHIFADWLKELEGNALAAVSEGEKDAAALAAALKLSEDSARYLLAHLAAREAITLTGKTNS